MCSKQRQIWGFIFYVFVLCHFKITDYHIKNDFFPLKLKTRMNILSILKELYYF